MRLKDLARVELGAADYNTNSCLNGQPAVALALFQRPGSNVLTTSEGALAAIAELARDVPAGLDYRVVYNPTEFVAESIDELLKTILETALPKPALPKPALPKPALTEPAPYGAGP